MMRSEIVPMPIIFYFTDDVKLAEVEQIAQRNTEGRNVFVFNGGSSSDDDVHSAVLTAAGMTIVGTKSIPCLKFLPGPWDIDTLLYWLVQAMLAKANFILAISPKQKGLCCLYEATIFGELNSKMIITPI